MRGRNVARRPPGTRRRGRPRDRRGGSRRPVAPRDLEGTLPREGPRGPPRRREGVRPRPLAGGGRAPAGGRGGRVRRVAHAPRPRRAVLGGDPAPGRPRPRERAVARRLGGAVSRTELRRPRPRAVARVVRPDGRALVRAEHARVRAGGRPLPVPRAREGGPDRRRTRPGRRRPARAGPPGRLGPQGGAVAAPPVARVATRARAPATPPVPRPGQRRQVRSTGGGAGAASGRTRPCTHRVGRSVR